VAAARAAMMLGPAEAGLRAEAAALGARFAALAAVRRLGAVGTAELAEAAAAVAAAREDLRAAIVAEGPAGPPAPDSAAAALAAGSETLTDLASRVAGQAVAGQAGATSPRPRRRWRRRCASRRGTCPTGTRARRR
jgi:hypothetical protein